MQIKLQHWLVREIIFFFLPLIIAAFPVVCLGQSQLHAGDLAMVNIEPGNPILFEFIPLVDIAEGTTIRFTSGSYVNEQHSLSDAEHELTYSAPRPVTAGTVISYSDEMENHFSGDGLDTKQEGDNILVYQNDERGTSFIFGIGWGDDLDVWTHQPELQEKQDSELALGLSEGEGTIIHFDQESGFIYDVGKGSAGSADTLLEWIGSEDNWLRSESGFRSLDHSFEVLNEPIIGFQDSLIEVTQPDSIDIPVELIEADGQVMSADIVLLLDQSTVSADDFDTPPVLNVSFSASDNRGAVKVVSMGTGAISKILEKQVAVFGLQNVTGGSVLPSREIIRIEIGPAAEGPDIIINEINFRPVTDADGNGLIDELDDEFIEIVNRGGEEADISGWMFSDNGSDVRHVFPEGTILSPGGALVLFANTDIQPEASYGGAIVQNTNQSVILDLDDTGDSPTLFDAEGNVIDSYTYGASDTEGQSLTRSPDISGNFREHSEAAGSAQLGSTPGTQVDGSSFGQSQIIGIRGREGWRAFAAPLQSASFTDLMSDLKTQGIPGSDEPSSEASVYFWDETGGGQMISPANLSDQMIAGRGYLFYYFQDSRRKIADTTLGIPQKITLDNSNSLNSVSIPVSATDANENGMIDGHEGFNLLGNPFNSYISVTALLNALEKVDQSINRNILVWNHAAGEGNGAFRILSDGDFIAPAEAFFIRFMDQTSGTAVLNLNELQMSRATELYRGLEEEDFGFKIHLGDLNHGDSYQLMFNEDGTMGSDELDAFKLHSLNPRSLNLYSRDGTDRLAKNILPENLEGVLEIPLVFEGMTGEQQYEFSWEAVGQIPEDWNILLRDEELNRETDLRNSSEYVFTHRIEENPEQIQSESLIRETSQEEPESRFTLVISPSATLASDQNVQSGSVKLNPNYPNPFNAATTIPFELSSETEVNLSIWNIVGQKVATLIDGDVVAAGEHTEPWNASDMPSGIYIAQLEAEGSVYIRKMTLIKN